MIFSPFPPPLNFFQFIHMNMKIKVFGDTFLNVPFVAQIKYNIYIVLDFTTMKLEFVFYAS